MRISFEDKTSILLPIPKLAISERGQFGQLATFSEPIDQSCPMVSEVPLQAGNFAII